MISSRYLQAVLALVLATALSPSVQAQQIAFRQETVGAEVTFAYRFRDLAKREHDLRFALAARDVEAAMQSFREYSLVGLNKHIEATMEAASRQYGVIVRFSMTSEGRRGVDLSGPQARVEAFRAELPRLLELARREYLSRHARHHEGNTVYVDYKSAVAQAVKPVAPLAAALARQTAGRGERDTVEHVLTFLQTIPYDDLTDVGRFGGVDFAPPAAMLKINAGDCDSKAVAMAALMRQMLPGRSIIVVRIPAVFGAFEHAVALADLPAQSGDAVLRHAGRSFVALEASAADVTAVGVVDPRVAARLQRGDVIAVEVGR